MFKTIKHRHFGFPYRNSVYDFVLNQQFKCLKSWIFFRRCRKFVPGSHVSPSWEYPCQRTLYSRKPLVFREPTIFSARYSRVSSDAIRKGKRGCVFTPSFRDDHRAGIHGRHREFEVLQEARQGRLVSLFVQWRGMFPISANPTSCGAVWY